MFTIIYFTKPVKKLCEYVHEEEYFRIRQKAIADHPTLYRKHLGQNLIDFIEYQSGHAAFKTVKGLNLKLIIVS